MSDPKHFDHILPFLQSADVHHAIPISREEIVRMHAIDDASARDAREHDSVDRQIHKQVTPTFAPE